MKVKVTRKQDLWNPNKVWLIRHYRDGHYTVNQEIRGRVLYRRFQRMKKRQIDSVFDKRER